MLRLILALSISTLFLPTAQAKIKAAANGDKKILDRVTSVFRPKGVLELIVEKTVESEWRGQPQVSKGVMHIGKERFRWEITEPEKSVVVFDGKTLWTIQEPAKDLKGPTQVTKSRVTGKAKNQILVKILSGGKSFSSRFKILKVNAKAPGVKEYQLEPVTPDPTVKQFSVIVEVKPENLRALSYTDEIGNKTTFQFLSKTPLRKSSTDLFKAEIPANAQVNEL